MVHDYCVIGGGIVGLASARHLLLEIPGASVVVLEKEGAPGRHQTGHNSGVIHAGVYYQPGSLKARLCKAGAIETKAFCDRQGIKYETRGKLIVATDAAERERMEALYERALGNSIEIVRLSGSELQERERNIRGVGALLVPASGIVDYGQICLALATEIRSLGGEIVFNSEVDSIEETPDGVHVTAGPKTYRCGRLIACAGLQSDRLARRAGLQIDHQIVPFRGEYYDVRPERRGIVHHMIYPVPDPALPFLGIHLTPTIDGGLTVGPNAVLGLAREGYGRFSFAPKDAEELFRFPGFWRLARREWRSGLAEMANSISKGKYLAQCRKYCPDLVIDDLLPREAGIRAQAVKRDGTLVHDFLFTQTPRSLHVGNAPSPAATSAFPIARIIVAKVMGRADVTQ
jgi:L-2-hydroxyglutarate oxidase